MRFILLILAQVDTVIESREKFISELTSVEKEEVEKLKKVSNFLSKDIPIDD